MNVSDIWNYYFSDPVTELYKFQCGSAFYTYIATSSTSCRFENAVYEPEYIVRTGLHYSSDYAKDTLTVTLPASNAVAQVFMTGTPEFLMRLTVYRGARKAAFIPIWVGLVNGASFDFTDNASSCDLTCETAVSRMERFGLARNYQLACPHTLYGAKCGVSQTAFASMRSVSAVNGFDVTVDGSAILDGYYLAGQLVKPDGSRRFISGNRGNILTLERRLPLSVGDAVTLYPGCDKARATCVSKFNNGAAYGGFPWMPAASPFTATIG